MTKRRTWIGEDRTTMCVWFSFGYNWFWINWFW